MACGQMWPDVQTMHNCKQCTISRLSFGIQNLILSLLHNVHKSESCLRMSRPKQLCYCRRCGGPDGPGKLMSYSNFCKHALQDQPQPSAAFDNALALISQAAANSQSGVLVNLPTVSHVHTSQQQESQMILDDALSTDSDSEEVCSYKILL